MWKGFQKPKRLAAELESLTDKYGKFSAQPFERGWGTTVGNALRRTLLSSIEGAAITAVRVEGVLHGHVKVNGRKVNIPSYLVSAGEELVLNDKMHQNTMVLEARNVAQSQNVVPWLDIDR